MIFIEKCSLNNLTLTISFKMLHVFEFMEKKHFGRKNQLQFLIDRSLVKQFRVNTHTQSLLLAKHSIVMLLTNAH